MHEYRLTRRNLVVDLGKGTLAVALLAACSSRTSGAASATSPGGSPSPAPSPSPEPPPPASGAAAGLAWSRVNLGFVSAYVLVRNRTAAVVDTGLVNSGQAIGQVLDAAGPGWSGVDHVILTHKHDDHAGGLGEVLTKATSATGWVGDADLAGVPAPPRPLKGLKDGDEVFGLTLVATPGHTPGHMSVFDPGSGLLVAGDALNNRGGLSGADPQFSEDMTRAAASVKALAKLPVRTILVGHGEPLATNAAQALTSLAASLG